MHPYREWVQRFERLLHEGASQPLGGLTPLPQRQPAPDAPVALILAPHPDDEVISGGLALRLMREAGWRVVDVAITLGSNEARQAERWRELEACCRFIGFELCCVAPGGLRQVNLATRRNDPHGWHDRALALAAIIARHAPSAIFFPHAEDRNTTHVGTHFLALDALANLGERFRTHVVETEFWEPSRSPNVMLELGAPDLADLVAALSFHAGEMRRNPYHLRLPAQLLDNVRRGAELVLGQGRPAPSFTFASLYRLRRWQEGGFADVLTEGQAVSVEDDVGALFAG